MGRILLISASFGDGHWVASRRLAEKLRGSGFDTTEADLLDLLPAGIGHPLRRAYRAQLAVAPRSWTWLFRAQATPGAGRLAVRLACLAADRVRELCTCDTEVVVSTYPLASQLLGELRALGALTVPAVTVLTDMAVHPLWIHPGVDAHIALHSVAARAARDRGARAVMIGGPNVPAAFRPASPEEQAMARAAFGLPLSGPLALIVAGSWGVGQISRTAVDIVHAGVATPVTACGRNRAGRARLTVAGTGIAIGWTDDMPALLRAVDVVVQSGGGLSAQEALVTGIPVVTYRPLPGHGQANAAALAAAGWAPWVRTRDELAAALATAIRRPGAPLTAGDPASLIASLAAESRIQPEPVRA